MDQPEHHSSKRVTGHGPFYPLTQRQSHWLMLAPWRYVSFLLSKRCTQSPENELNTTAVSLRSESISNWERGTDAIKLAGGDAIILPQNRVQMLTVKLHWKNKCWWVSIPEAQSTQLFGTFNPHTRNLSRVGIHPRMAIQAAKDHLGIFCLNQITFDHETKAERFLILSQVAFEENFGR